MENSDNRISDIHKDNIAQSEDSTPKSERKKIFSVWKVLLPVAIGLTVVALMFFHDVKKENMSAVWDSIHFTPFTIFCIVLGFLFMFGRDFGLTWRFRALTDHKLPWKSAYEVDFLCEFTSCITPSAVGGSSLGMVFLNSKGIEFGRATTLMMTTLILDESFFVLFCPLVILLTPSDEIFASGGAGFSHGLKLTFWIVYSFLFAWTLLLYLGVILKPKWIKKVLHNLFNLRWLRRWQENIDNLTNNMIATSAELKSKPFKFWLEVFFATALSWTSRFLVVNAIFLGFLSSADPWQWVILVRQFIIWVVLMVSPTPGGSGLSEWLFSEYYGDIVTSAGLALIMAVIWRIISYYIYLIIGAIIVPGWLNSSVKNISIKKQDK